MNQHEDQITQLLDDAPVTVYLTAPDTSCFFLNRRWYEFTGQAPGAGLGAGWTDVIHPDDRESSLQTFLSANAAREAFRLDYRLCNKKGNYRWSIDIAAPRFGPGGEFLGFIGAVIDIHDRKEAEEALQRSEHNLRELSRSLEQRVAERTAALHEQAARLQQLAADLTSTEQRERKRLAALLHDDLQQLLVAASMHLKKATRGMKNQFDRQLVEQAARWVSEATGAARTLTHELRPPALYEGDLVSALYGLASNMAARHHLNVAVEGTELPSPMNDDIKALLFESVRELLFNSAKHAGVDKATVKVWEEAQWLHIVVTDRGKGFDISKVEQSPGQSGFGLFSIRERLAALGGRLTIGSAPGEGTRATMEVPLLTEILEEQKTTEVTEPPHRKGRIEHPAAPYDGERIRVMVVDDHAMVRQGLATLLDEDERIEVVGEAADGLAALEAVEKQRPDVMLVDLNMPRMNGIEATREIHRHWPETIIIGLSVQDDEATARAICDAGAAAFLPKAGDSDRMIATILELADRAHRHKT